MELAHIVETAAYDCPFDCYMHVIAVVDFLDKPRNVDIHCAASTAATILRSFPGAVVRDAMIEDTDHEVLVLRLGSPVEHMRSVSDVLVRCQTLIREPMKTESEISDMSKTLGELLREKFGDPDC
jgi:hypothetical protein